MKHLILLISILTRSILCNAQNVVYDENAEVRTVASFNGVDVSGSISVYLSQGTAQGVAVSAGEEKYNDKIKTEVKNGVLKIFVDGGVWNSFNWVNKKLKAYVTVTDLNRIEVSGASYMSLSGAVKSEDLKIDVSGASEVKGIVNVSKLNIDVSGASVVRLSGTAKDGLIDASGACKITSYDLVLDRCNVSTSGASSIRVTVNNELNADASGGSTIYYKGAGVVKSVSTSGGGSIKNRSGDDD